MAKKKNLNNKNYSKDKKQCGRRYGKEDTRMARAPKTGNPWDWHVANPGVLEDIGKLNFNYALGSRMPLLPKAEDEYKNPVIPGILCVHYLPNFGAAYAGSLEDGLNMATNQLFAFQRSKNAGSTNYTAQDPMMFLGAMSSVYTWYYCLIRLYGTINLYTQRNLYYPRAIVEAMGFDYDDFVDNIGNFKFWLDHIASVINMRSAPKAFTAMAYQMFRVTELYRDVDEDKAQVFFYMPDVYYVYQGYTDTKGGMLHAKFIRGDLEETDPSLTQGTVPNYTNLITFDRAKEIMEEMLTAILADEDFTVIWGDLIKAYGVENMYSVPTVGNDYVVVPRVDAVESWTLHNTYLAGYPCTDKSEAKNPWTYLDIHQDPEEGAVNGGRIYYSPKLLTYAGGSISNFAEGYRGYIIDVPYNLSSPEMLVDVMRNIPVPRDTATTGLSASLRSIDGLEATTHYNYSFIGSCGSVLTTYAEILTYGGIDADTGRPSYAKWRFTSDERVFPIDGSDLDATPERTSVTMQKVSNVHNHPIIYLWGQTVSGNVTDISTFGNLDHATVAGKEFIDRFNLTTNYSELAVKTV